MLTSTMSAPMPSTICAAAAILSGSPPKIWMETGRSSSVYSAYSSVRSMPRTRPSELTISVTTSPQPPLRLTRRRNAVSVMPAIGAMAYGDSSATLPIRIIVILIGLHVRRVDFDADGLSDQIDGQDEPRALRILPHQPPDDAAERTVDDFDHRPLADHRARVELQLAADEQPDAFELEIGNRRRLAFERHDVHHAGALQDGQRIVGIELREAVAGKQRPVDLFLAVLPAAQARDGGKEGVNLFSLELLADNLLVPGARPNRVPVGVAHCAVVNCC